MFGANKGEDLAEVLRFFNKHNGEMARKGQRLKIVFNESSRGHVGEILKHPQLFEVKYLQHTTPAEINIWADRVMITILSKKPTVILIQNKGVAQSFLEYFNVMWAIAKN